MNFLQRWVGRAFKLTDVEPWSAYLNTGTYTGKQVTEGSSLQLTTVWGCVRLLSETVGSLPLHVYRKTGDSRVRVNYHPLERLLGQRPNKRMTGVEFREAVVTNLALWGNAYIDFTKRKREVISLKPLPSERMTVEVDDSLVKYTYHTGKEDVIYGPGQLVHVKGFGVSGHVGLSPIGYCKQAVAWNSAMEEFGARFFGSGGKPAAFIVYSGWLTPEQRTKLREKYGEVHEGLENSHKLAILEGGMTYQQISVKPDEAQFLESRKFGVNEICRIFRVPPHMVQDLERATFSNIENQALEFATYTLKPYLTRLEQCFNTLFTAQEQSQGFYVEFNLDGLLRADSEARSKFLSSMVQNGIMTRNEARTKENQPRSDQDGADDLTVQSNMIDLDQLPKVGVPQ